MCENKMRKVEVQYERSMYVLRRSRAIRFFPPRAIKSLFRSTHYHRIAQYRSSSVVIFRLIASLMI